jgi:hypothetical protein
MNSLRDYVEEGPVGKRRLPVINAVELDDEDDGEDDIIAADAAADDLDDADDVI